MPLLVDGHNLIGQIPGIDLADPDDEARLVMLLRRYATRKRGRQVIVVFDHGVYGHPHDLNGYGVTCYFAKSPRDADSQLIKRLKSLNRPGDWTLVTSDRHVADAARERGVRVIDSREFVGQLLGERAPAQAPRDEKRDVQLSEGEVEEWLRLFGERPSADTADGASSGAGPSQDDGRAEDAASRRRKRQRGR